MTKPKFLSSLFVHKQLNISVPSISDILSAIYNHRSGKGGQGESGRPEVREEVGADDCVSTL